MIDDLLDLLAPDALQQLLRPFDEAREAYEPRVLQTDSHDEMLDELARFVAHAQAAWWGPSPVWPPDLCRDIARRALAGLGDGLHPKAGEFAALKMSHYGERGGMRRILDHLMNTLREQALIQYLDYKVLPLIGKLTPDEQIELAQAYAELYPTIGSMAHDHPASIALRWRQIIHQHARAVLHGD